MPKVRNSTLMMSVFRIFAIFNSNIASR